MRCDLGPVDDPHDPPCVRCRRESKECYFSATRRKRKADEEGSQPGDEYNVVDDYAQRNGRKTARTSISMANTQPGGQQEKRSTASGSFSGTSPLDGYSLAGDGSYQQPSPFPAGRAASKSEDGQDQEVTNDTAAALFQSPINIPGDALHLLLKASGQSEDLQRRDSTGKSATVLSPVQADYPYTKTAALQASQGPRYDLNIDPAIAEDRRANSKTPIPKQTLDVWSRLRFVRAGWFTAKEGISYVN